MGAILVNAAGNKVTDASVNVSGAWREVKSGWVNVSGVWQEIYPTALLTIGQWTSGGASIVGYRRGSSSSDGDLIPKVYSGQEIRELSFRPSVSGNSEVIFSLDGSIALDQVTIELTGLAPVVAERVTGSIFSVELGNRVILDELLSRIGETIGCIVR